MLYSLDEICLQPSVISPIDSRSQCSPSYYDFGADNKHYLPIFAAPMYSVSQTVESRKKFEDQRIRTIVPRTVPFVERIERFRNGECTAFSLNETSAVTMVNPPAAKPFICIDLANGHMYKCINLCKQIKSMHPNWLVMVGNIAHPETYRKYAEAGVDFVRVGIGSGNVCTTAVQTGMYYPMASLLIEISKIKKELTGNVPKVVADGGFKYIDQMVKALALGADYVMVGKLLAQTNAASGKTRRNWLHWFRKEREYFGMSTEKAQKLMNPDKPTKPSEGKVTWVPVKYDLHKWVCKFTHALKSSMSYAGKYDLESFVGGTNWDIMTPSAFSSYIKPVDE